MAPNKQTLAELDKQQQNGMEGEPVHQTRRGVERRPPGDKKRRNEATTDKTGGSQERCGKNSLLGRLGKLQRGTSRQSRGTRSTSRRLDIITQVGTIDVVMDILDETVILEGGRLNLD